MYLLNSDQEMEWKLAARTFHVLEHVQEIWTMLVDDM